MRLSTLLTVAATTVAMTTLSGCPEDPVVTITDGSILDAGSETIGGGDSTGGDNGGTPDSTVGCTNDSDCVASDECKVAACIGGVCQETNKADGTACTNPDPACNDSATCSAGACNVTPAAPSCGAAVCGTDACGNSCGTCAAGESCVSGACTGAPQGCGDITFEGCCTNDNVLQWCQDGQVQTLDCTNSDGGPLVCSWWADNSFFGCIGELDETPAEFEYLCPGEECTATCEDPGVECGTVCGVDCGGCGDGQFCGADNTCQACACGDDQDCGVDECGNSCGECGAGETCLGNQVCIYDACQSGVGFTGCCDPTGELTFWCEEGQPQVAACQGNGCGWDSENNFYDCGQSGADPSGTSPLECPAIQVPDQVEVVEQAEVVESVPDASTGDADAAAETIDDSSTGDTGGPDAPSDGSTGDGGAADTAGDGSTGDGGGAADTTTDGSTGDGGSSTDTSTDTSTSTDGSAGDGGSSSDTSTSTDGSAGDGGSSSDTSTSTDGSTGDAAADGD